MNKNYELKDWSDVVEFFKFMKSADRGDEEYVAKMTQEMMQFSLAIEKEEDLREFLIAMLQFGSHSAIDNAVVSETDDNAHLDPEKLQNNIYLNLTTFATIFFEFGSLWGRSGMGEISIPDSFGAFLDGIEEKNTDD